MDSLVNFVHGSVHHNLSERQTGAVFPPRAVYYNDLSFASLSVLRWRGCYVIRTGNGCHQSKVTLTQVVIGLM